MTGPAAALLARLLGGPCATHPPPVFPTGGRTLTVSGLDFAVRASAVPTGAGPSRWSDAAVSADGSGLTLVLGADARGPLGAEVRAPLPRRTRHLSFTTWMPAGLGSPDVVAAVFLYRSDRCELDLELGQWGDAAAPRAQYAAHGRRTVVHRFDLDPARPAHHTLTLRGRRATWSTTQDGVEIARWQARLRRTRGLALHLNLWTRGPHPGGPVVLRVTDLRVGGRAPASGDLDLDAGGAALPAP